MFKKPVMMLAIAAAAATVGISTPAAAQADPVLGALVGGTIGAAIGHGVSGRDGAWVGGALGAVTGACIGLFIVAPGKDAPLIGPVTLSGSAISFIAGFGVEAVFQALAQFLHDSLDAERVTLTGAVQIVLSLLADLCAMLMHQYAHTAEEVEARIDRLSRPLLSQITAYHRQRDQEG